MQRCLLKQGQKENKCMNLMLLQESVLLVKGCGPKMAQYAVLHPETAQDTVLGAETEAKS